MRKLTYPALFLLASAFTASAADADITVGGGTGTADDPYIISTAAHVIEVSNACHTGTTAATNSHFTGKYFKMTADIDMSGITDFYGIGSALLEKVSNNNYYYFDGTFDGGGYSIRNMKIAGCTYEADGKVQAAAANKSRNYVGFFGTLGPYATIKNLNIDASCSIEGFSYVGSIAGSLKAANAVTSTSTPASGSQIINCSSAATLTVYSQYCGGIAGHATRATANGMVTIDGCSFSGSLKSNYGNCGGIVGYATLSEVKNCVNTGSVEAYYFNAQRAESNARTIIGGVVGYSNNSTVSDCLNAGPVYGSGNCVGGIAGSSQRSGENGKLTNCVSIGSVSCPDLTQKGMISGKNSTSANGAAYITNCYFDEQLTAQMGPGVGYLYGLTATGLTTAKMTSGTALEGLDPDVWTFEAGFYPRLKKFDNDALKRVAATYFTLGEGVTASDFTGTATISSAMPGITATVKEGTPSITVSGSTITATAPTAITQSAITLTNGSYSVEIPVMQVPVLFQGEGTEANPYLINNKADIMNLAESVNGVTLNHYEGKHFRLTADIDMGRDEEFMGIGAGIDKTQNPHNTWYFSGIFDGQGHTISNLKLDHTVFNAAGTSQAYAQGSLYNTGFFGTLGEGAVVRNLHFDATDSIAGHMYVGTVAGRMLPGARIENVTSAAVVEAYAGGYAGGIAGYVDAETPADGTVAVIANSLFTGSVKASANYVAGIAGYSKGEITLCANTGEVKNGRFNGTGSTFRYAAGIAGYNLGFVRDCANYAPISSQGATAGTDLGGITGQTTGSSNKGTVERSFNSGVATTSQAAVATCGAVVGSKGTGTTLKFTGNVFDRQLALYGAMADGDADGFTGMNTSALTDGSKIEDLGDAWTFTKGYYPILTVWAANADVKAAAATYFTLPDGQSISDFKTEGVIATTMPLTATLADGTSSFSISGGKILSGNPSEIARDTLVLTNGRFSDRYPLMKTPPVLPGSGTQADPWQVASVEDFNKLGKYMIDAKYSFENEYVSLLADLDYTGKEFNAAGDANNPFNGTFLGNNHVIKNVSVAADPEAKRDHVALFHTLGTGSTVENLTLSNVKIAGYGYIAGIAAVSDGAVRNITVDADCEFTGTRVGTATTANQDGSYVAAIVAQANENATFDNCVNRAPISTTRWYAAGIVGNMKTAGTNVQPRAYIRDCANYGNVTSTAPQETTASGGGNPQMTYKDAFIGGIAGQLYGEISRCVNEGDVTASTANTIGGITGMVNPGSSLDSCVNRGDVKGANYIGGVYGNRPSTIPTSVTLTTPIAKCVSYGAVSGRQYVAGVGACAGTGYSFTDCANHGEVSSTLTTDDGHHIAGICSYTNLTKADQEINFTRCYNTGAIIGGSQLAGLIAYAQQGFAIVNECFNTGTVTQVLTKKATLNIVGGLASGYVKVKNSYNTGDISLYTGGGLGYALAGATAENFYNMGALNALDPSSLGEIASVFINNRDGVAATNCYGLKTSATEYDFDKQYNVNMVDSLGMLTANLGEAFSKTPAAFPMIASLDTVPEAQFAAAWYLLSEGDTPDKLTGPVTLANLSHVVWTGNDIFTIENGIATPNGKGEATLTKTAGTQTRTYAFVSDAGEPQDVTIDGLNFHKDFEKLEAIVMPGEYTGAIVIPAKFTDNNKEYTVVGVAESAFQNSTITSVSIPATVKSVGKDGFRNISTLKSVETPSIADWVQIVFANSNSNPIYNCGTLSVAGTPVGTTLTVPEGVKQIGAYSFRGLTTAETLSLPASLEKIGNGAFHSCSGLKSAVIPDGCTDLGESLFWQCTSLEDATFPASITAIPANTFYGCTGLKKYTVAEGIKTIGTMAFNGCSSLEELTLPESLESLDMMALMSCSALKSLRSKALTPPTVGMMAFDEIKYDLCTLYVAQSAIEAYKNAEEWKNFLNIQADMSGVSTVSVDDLTDVRYFTLDGREIAEPSKGMVVIATGTTPDGRRVAVKKMF